MAKRKPRYPDLAAFFRLNPQLSQSDVAEHLGFSQAQMNRYIRGQRIPRPVQLLKLVEYCDVPLDSFTKTYMRRHRIGEKKSATNGRKRSAA